MTLYCQGVVKGKACVQYYTMMGEVAHYLQQAADPVKFMCQVITCSFNNIKIEIFLLKYLHSVIFLIHLCFDFF